MMRRRKCCKKHSQTPCCTAWLPLFWRAERGIGNTRRQRSSTSDRSCDCCAPCRFECLCSTALDIQWTGSVSQEAAREHTLAKQTQMEAKRAEAISKEPRMYECRGCGMECPCAMTLQLHKAEPCRLNESAPLWRALTGKLYI